MNKLLALGQAIRLRRRNLGLTQTQVAKKLGRSIGLVSKMENGQHPLDFKTLSDFAKILKIKIVIGANEVVVI